MTDFSFAPLVRDTRSALSSGAPDDALRTFRVESQQSSGLRSDVRIRQFEIGVDEPPTLGGADTAPNPVEYALLALATCQEITYRLHADHLGIPLEKVAVTLEGDIDLRGFFAVDEAVRPGFRAIRGTVTLDELGAGFRPRATAGPRRLALPGARPAVEPDAARPRAANPRPRLTIRRRSR